MCIYDCIASHGLCERNDIVIFLGMIDYVYSSVTEPGIFRANLASTIITMTS